MTQASVLWQVLAMILGLVVVAAAGMWCVRRIQRRADPLHTEVSASGEVAPPPMERRGMLLVRLRDGVLPSGKPLPHRSPLEEGAERMCHVVPATEAKEPVTMSGATNAECWTSRCGLEFEPGTVEVVAWGTQFPHRVCVHKSGFPASVVARLHREEHDTSKFLAASDEELAESVVALTKLMDARNTDEKTGTHDWEYDAESRTWTFDASFNGVFPGDSLYPRGVDLGLERLRVELPYPGVVHIHASGVRDGCTRHLVRTETFALGDAEALEKRVYSHEIVAAGILLNELALCLITGPCAKAPVYE